MRRFFVIYFILVAIGMSTLELPMFSQFYQAFGGLLAILAGGFVQLFDSNITVSHTIIGLTNGGFPLEITKECLGMETSILFAAALITWNARWQYKLLGLSISILLIQLVNIIRLIILLYISKWYPDNFALMHDNLFPLLFAIFTVILFVYWLKFLENR